MRSFLIGGHVMGLFSTEGVRDVRAKGRICHGFLVMSQCCEVLFSKSYQSFHSRIPEAVIRFTVVDEAEEHRHPTKFSWKCGEGSQLEIETRFGDCFSRASLVWFERRSLHTLDIDDACYERRGSCHAYDTLRPSLESGLWQKLRIPTP